jgi:hypothetical protein
VVPRAVLDAVVKRIIPSPRRELNPRTAIVHPVAQRYTTELSWFSCLFKAQFNIKSRDSSAGITLGFGLDDRGSRARFLAGAGNSSLHHREQNGSGAHPAFYPMGTRGSFPGNKAVGA